VCDRGNFFQKKVTLKSSDRAYDSIQSRAKYTTEPVNKSWYTISRRDRISAKAEIAE
jgi:hypothetical protein